MGGQGDWAQERNMKVTNCKDVDLVPGEELCKCSI